MNKLEWGAISAIAFVGAVLAIVVTYSAEFYFLCVGLLFAFVLHEFARIKFPDVLKIEICDNNKSRPTVYSFKDKNMSIKIITTILMIVFAHIALSFNVPEYIVVWAIIVLTVSLNKVFKFGETWVLTIIVTAILFSVVSFMSFLQHNNLDTSLPNITTILKILTGFVFMAMVIIVFYLGFVHYDKIRERLIAINMIYTFIMVHVVFKIDILHYRNNLSLLTLFLFIIVMLQKDKD